MSKTTYLLLSILLLLTSFQVRNAQAQGISDEVIIRRTEFGVPHIQAKNLMAAGFAMGYLQMEDYGRRVTDGLIRGRGEWAKYHELTGRALENQLDNDAAKQLLHVRAVETFALLRKETRDLIQGYADGINRYIQLHPEEFSDELKPNFTAYDVHATSIGSHSNSTVKAFIRKLHREQQTAYIEDVLDETNLWTSLAMNSKEEDNPDVGSNVWALAPERTTSGNAILMRNPHLNWTAGYYEAQMNVEGHFNFYGDFRIGQPLGIVGGFNEFLGWCTTNNNPKTDEIYAFELDPENPENYLLDGTSRPVEIRTVFVNYKSGGELKTEKREFKVTPYGPVIHRTNDKLYIIRSADEGEYRTTEQFLRMMEAKNLEEWKEGMRMQAKSSSNLTYADVEGNIFYVWNGSVPLLKQTVDKNSNAILIKSHSEIWDELYPWDDLPQLLNPKGGYLRNENDPFHFTNMNEVFNENDFPDNFPRAQLRLRSQLSVDLIGGNDKLSLEDVIERKHDMTMLLADRVKGDLLQFAGKVKLNKNEKKALKQLQKWDNTVAKESVGGVLFELWWDEYVNLVNDGIKRESTPESAGFAAPAEKLFKAIWSQENPINTPYGLADEQKAVEAFKLAVQEAEEKYGTLKVKWGDVHRAIIGDQDYPIGGASGTLGAFRVLWFDSVRNEPNKKQVTGGDCWVLAVEFDKTPRAYSVLAYGESNKETSPYYADQLKMFVDNKMKKVFYTQEDVEENTIHAYRPGVEN